MRGSECELADLASPPRPKPARHASPRGPSELTFDFVGGVHRAADVEKELIVPARLTRGNVSRAARLIGMQRSSLRYRIERYQLADLVKREEEAAQT